MVITHIEIEEGSAWARFSEILSLVPRLDLNETIVRTCAADACHGMGGIFFLLFAHEESVERKFTLFTHKFTHARIPP